MVGSPLRVAPAAFDAPETQALVDRVQAEYVTLYGTPDSSPIGERAFEWPDGAFFLGHADGVAVAMGGWRRRTDVWALGRGDAAEVKRMYVAPAVRRRGYAAVLLAHLEQSARDAGADVMVLETGTMQPAAIATYQAQGYERVGNFGYYSDSPLSRCFGKLL